MRVVRNPYSIDLIGRSGNVWLTEKSVSTGGPVVFLNIRGQPLRRRALTSQEAAVVFDAIAEAAA